MPWRRGRGTQRLWRRTAGEGLAYNLNEDPTEQNNLADEMLEIVAELPALVDAHNATQRDPLFPAVAEMPVTIDKTLEEEAPEEDEYIYWPG